MKDRTRQAVFDLLGPAVAGKHAIDLFAGTGALALEAISRGATKATMIDRHFPTARIIEQNVADLGAANEATVVAADVFIWVRKFSTDDPQPWVVFCSPPYDLYVDRSDDMLALISQLCELAPRDSLVVVECDDRFDPACLPAAELWDVRQYSPAVIAIYQQN